MLVIALCKVFFLGWFISYLYYFVLADMVYFIDLLSVLENEMSTNKMISLKSFSIQHFHYNFQ